MKCLYVGSGIERLTLTEHESVSEDLLSKISWRQLHFLSRESGTPLMKCGQISGRPEAAPGFMALLTRYLELFRPDIVHFDSPGDVDLRAALLAAKNVGAATVMSLQEAEASEDDGLRQLRTTPGVSRPGGQNFGRRESDRLEHAQFLKARAVRQSFSHLKPVDRYIAPSYDVQSRLAATGMVLDRIAIMPAIVMPRLVIENPKPRQPFALFAGRLTPDSGIRAVLDAWKFTNTLGLTLVVAGDGPLALEVEADGAKLLRLTDNGMYEQLDYLMRRASCLLAPSGFGEAHIIARAFASGLPVIAPDTRAAAEMIDVGRTGYLFREGDPELLSAALRHAYESVEALRVMGDAAAEEFRRRFSPSILRRRLTGIYRETVQASRDHARSR
jgi:glycosyltransferase involved in cell wall biosynthesis